MRLYGASRRWSSWALWVLAVAVGLPARASWSIPVRLTSPAAGEVWTAGSWATLEWEPAGERLPAAEEWEAFLSVDGGATYAVRLTPHLDLDVRRFAFEVPRLPTSRARLLLRFGDERRENAFEVPLAMTIADAPTVLPWSGEIPLWRVQPGEAARQNERGVVMWIQGSRRGDGVRVEVAIPADDFLDGTSPASHPLFLLLGGPAPARHSLAAPGFAAAPEPRPLPALGPAEGTLVRSASTPVRLLIHRFNE